MSTAAWTPKRAAANSYRSIRALKAAADKHLDNIALGWSDEDSFLEHEAHDAYERIVQLLDELDTSIRESMAAKDEEAKERAADESPQESLLP